MRIDFRKIFLISITVIFVFLGLSLVSFSFKEAFLDGKCYYSGKFLDSGTKLDDYKGQRDCLCNNGKILCVQETQPENTSLTREDYINRNLSYSFKYLSSTVSSEVLGSPLSTKFLSIDKYGKGIKIALEQGQFCTDKYEPASQIGLYNYSGGVLTLLSVVNQINTIYINPCTISVTYIIDPLTLDFKKGVQLQYSNDEGEIVKADVCVYNNNLYSEGDLYEASDGCNICECRNGVSKCTSKDECVLEN